MKFKEYLEWLVIGVEDGWIKVDQKVWREYLIAKEYLERQKGYKKM